MPRCRHDWRESIRFWQPVLEVDWELGYAFGLSFSTVIVGKESMAQLEHNLAIAESFTPLSDAERLAFFQRSSI